MHSVLNFIWVTNKNNYTHNIVSTHWGNYEHISYCPPPVSRDRRGHGGAMSHNIVLCAMVDFVILVNIRSCTIIVVQILSVHNYPKDCSQLPLNDRHNKICRGNCEHALQGKPIEFIQCQID